MKKITCFVLCFSLILSMLYPVPAKALNTISSYETISEIEYLENGDYIVSTIISRTDISTTTTYATAVEVKGDKVSTYYDKNGKAMWSITVVATFKCVEGVSVSLQSYSGYGTSYNSNWKVHDVKARRSSDIAICEGQGTHYFTIVEMETVDAYVDLRCNTYGLLR